MAVSFSTEASSATQLEFPPRPGTLPKTPNRIPAYILPEEQSAFRLQLQKNAFTMRDRTGRGRALCQRLIVCGLCGARLTVADPGREAMTPYYQCTKNSATLAMKPCLSFPAHEVDAAVEREFLAAVASPPLEVLDRVLREACNAEETRGNALESERKRLQYQEVLARDRYESIDPRNTLVFAAAVEELEKAKRATKAFELRLSAAPPSPKQVETAAELQALSELVSDVPRLWRHPLVSMKDRKEMLACLINRIVVARTTEAIEATIVWASGAEIPLRVWRRAGVWRLIRERHAEGLTVPQIQAWLAQGDPETGQRWKRTRTHIYAVLRRAGLRVNPAPRGTAVDRAKLQRLYDESRTLREIVASLNTDGLRTPQGKPWTENTVWHWLGVKGRRAELERLHREALADAKERGLTARAAAEEFNASGLPRVGGRQWSADAVRQRRAALNRRLRRQRQQVDLAGQALRRSGAEA